MVKQLILLLLAFPYLLFSAEFTASLRKTQVNLSEPFILNLTLKDASANDIPALDLLKHSFVINSQQQSSNTIVRNGKVSSSVSWQISLTAKAVGEAIIPSIEINTTAGPLATTPIKLEIVKGSVSDSNTNEISIATNVNNLKPFKNEPVFLKVQMSSKINLANIKIQNFSIEDAIVESNGEPVIGTKIIDGVRVHIIEYNYLITPLKTGSLKIPAIVIQGGIPMKRQHRGGLDDDFEPLASMLGFTQLKPFTAVSNEVDLEVTPPIAGIVPWLPAKSIVIEESWDPSQLLQVGEPIVRSFKIVAEGIASSQLPSLNDLQIIDKGFKIYADKPEFQDKITGNNIYSYRKEQYTLIPQQSGTLTLPEITLVWWDVTKNEKSFAYIPARTLEIAPLATNPLSSADLDENFIPADISKSHSVGTALQGNGMLIIALILLSTLLLAAVVIGIILQRKIMRMQENLTEHRPINKPTNKINVLPLKKGIITAKNKKEKLPDLNPT